MLPKQMQRARVRSFLHHTKMDNLAFPWVLHITLTLPWFLEMSPIVQPLWLIQKNGTKHGRVRWVTLLALVLQGGRSMLQSMNENRQNHIRQPTKIEVPMLVVKERAAWFKIECLHQDSDLFSWTAYVHIVLMKSYCNVMQAY